MTVRRPGTPVPSPPPTKWDTFLYWSGRFHQDDTFDEFERDYKIKVAGHLQAAKTALFADDPAWLDKLHYAITAPPNNLTNWRETQAFESWCRKQPENGKVALRRLWDEGVPVARRMDTFAEAVAPSGRPARIAETSFFHMVMDPCAFPIYRSTPVDKALDLTGYPTPQEVGVKSGELGRRYEHFLTFLDIMIKRAANSGLVLRDRLDAQSAAWMVTQWPALECWTESDRQAFSAYQGRGSLIR